MGVQVEICVDRVADAIAATAAGVDRIEFCAGLGDAGGVTPSAGSIRAVRAV
ncbi:MAG: copper homeostasis protein CutC, partial [Planctomycetes bacterium]|nr:copper homeostasis protein CutC [Planctomycetota bacterium]